ncbi:MAG TPA: M48 family metallopeptidase [Vicinamibacterales bacterium]
MNSAGWLVRRALLAIALMIGFYVLAFGIAGALLWIPYAEWAYLGRIHPKIALMCVAAAGAVLWAIVPRPDRFEPPGPRLDASQCPALFAMIREVAQATGQAPPAEVYLVNEVNAWVSQRGGIMGIGSRRVMGIGLPLMQGVSQQELKAIIAHEFGHYSSGDVSLGPWIYKTRAAIVRAVQGLEEGWLSLPFQWYGTMFIRLTHAVSRQQEFVADAIAARVAGVAAAASALRRVTGVAAAHSAFVGNELVPVMREGSCRRSHQGSTSIASRNRSRPLRSG